MTTKSSPIQVLKVQADRIAKTLKDAEAGKPINAYLAEKIKAARMKDVFKTGIVMDDKIITLELSWLLIKSLRQVALAKYILDQMQEAGDAYD